MGMSENETAPEAVEQAANPPRKPRWICMADLQEIVKILTAADQISTEEAVRRLNNMQKQGTIFFFPKIGAKIS
jgi:hypothetical protein